jgi:hypothetical protein
MYWQRSLLLNYRSPEGFPSGLRIGAKGPAKLSIENRAKPNFQARIRESQLGDYVGGRIE